MSAPDRNIEKQEARHKPALLGIKGAVVFGFLAMFPLAFFVFGTGGSAPILEEATSVNGVSGNQAAPATDN